MYCKSFLIPWLYCVNNYRAFAIQAHIMFLYIVFSLFILLILFAVFQYVSGRRDLKTETCVSGEEPGTAVVRRVFP